MLTSETKRRIDSCRDILVGKLPLPSDQVELITLALIYKFMDDLDEESVRIGGRRSFFVDGLKQYRWRALMPQTVSAESRMNLFAEGIETLGGNRANGKDPAKHLPQLFRDVFRNEFLKFRDGRILTLFLNEINGFAYDHSEELGNAFEYLLQCMGTQGENGQFRTPRHIIDFMVACLDPRPNDRILDPACGTGGFLVSSFKHIMKKHTSPDSNFPGDQLNGDQRQRLYQNLAGYDITDLMVKLSKVNLFLHGFPDPAIHIYDTLSNDARWNDKADVILANPPFMTPKGGVAPHAKFRVQAKKAEVLFTDYIAEHLSPDGRGAVIVPNGIVATTQNAYVQLRRFLIEDSLVAVVSLPAGVFKPYSGVKTSILFLNKALARRTKEILFLKVTADGFDLGDQRRPIAQNDLPEAERVVKAWMKGKKDIETLLELKSVAKDDLLQRSDASLSAERFMGVVEVDSEHPTVQLRDVCSIRSGGTPSRQNEAFWRNGRTRWISSKHIGEDHRAIGGEMITDAALEGSATNLVPAKSLVLITRVSVGKWAFLDESLAINQDLTALTPTDNRLLPEFLKCVGPRLAAQIDASAVGVGVRGVTREFVGDLEIPLPPLEEQRRIVEEIENYQKIIDAARQILATYRPRLDVDPEWPMVPIGEIAKVGGSIKKKIEKCLPYIGSDSIESATGKLIQKKSCEEQGIAGPVYEFEGVRILYSKIRPYLNKLTLTDFHGYCSSDVYPLLVDEEKASPHFLKFHLLSEEFIAAIAGFLERVSIPKINRQQLFSVEIPLPPLDEQRRIVAELDAEAAQIEAVRALIPTNEAKIQRVLDRVWKQGN